MGLRTLLRPALTAALAGTLGASLLLACGSPGTRTAATSGRRALPEVAPPVALSGTAYEFAQAAECIDATPQEWDDLHNVFELSPNIISGSEPHGEAALRRISEMGVKTILSTDGKVPDAETAAKYGMRYVHVPIHYSGISPEELTKISKTFRELDGPFYVHCYHGKHRGPAGAGVGRLVLDGAPREEVLAQMVQCGTSKKYEGLYRVLAAGEMPAPEETAAYDWDFPSAHPFGGTRAAMIEMARVWDNLVLLGKNGWRSDPAHPDIDAVNESEKLEQLFSSITREKEFSSEPDDFRGWMVSGLDHAAKLRQAIRAHRDGDAAAGDVAQTALAGTKESCGSCHATYRNE